MSYILDALRRAEAERERGAVPGLHSQSSTVPPTGDAPFRSGLPAGVWLAGGLGLGLFMAAIAWWWAADRATSAPSAAPMSSQSSVGMTIASAPMLPASPPGNAALESRLPATVLPVQAAQDAAAPPPPVATRRTPPVASAATPPATAGDVADSARQRLGVADAGAAKAEAPGAAAAPAEPVARPLSVSERQRLPKLTLGGSMYSEDRASRMLVINDQVVREGERAAPGVTLERIGPHAAELSFEGKRFELPY